MRRLSDNSARIRTSFIGCILRLSSKTQGIGTSFIYMIIYTHYIYIYYIGMYIYIHIQIFLYSYTYMRRHIHPLMHTYVYMSIYVFMFLFWLWCIGSSWFALHTSAAHGMHGDAIASTAPGASATTSWSGTHVCISWEEIYYTQGRSAWSSRAHVHHGWYVSQGVGRLCGECRPSGHRQ